MKYIIIVPDGMADYPIKELGDKTPLEAARRTNMDYLAQQGMTGLLQTIPEGMNPGSDIGNLALLGTIRLNAIAAAHRSKPPTSTLGSRMMKLPSVAIW